MVLPRYQSSLSKAGSRREETRMEKVKRRDNLTASPDRRYWQASGGRISSCSEDALSDTQKRQERHIVQSFFLIYLLMACAIFTAKFLVEGSIKLGGDAW